jgi:hypothetical protein
MTRNPVEDAQRHLDALCSVHLLQQTSRQRYRYEALEHAYALRRDQIEDADVDRATAEQRLLDWCLTTARRAIQTLGSTPAISDREQLCHPSRTVDSVQDALSWLETERPNIIAATKRAAELRVPDA